jgi:NDP-sugar pyrophosphorylase family protein
MAVEHAVGGTILELQSEPRGRVVIQGERNTLRVGKNVVLNASIWLQGTGTVIDIADNCIIEGMIHVVRGEGGVVRIGEGTTFGAVGISLHEEGEIIIGKDCLFSTDIHMDVSDMHPIYDADTRKRINPAKSIEIGDHVWLGQRVLVLKGATIGSGCVVGANSTVVGELPQSVVAVGSPAKVVRENIIWERNFDDVVIDRSAAGKASGGWRQRLGLGKR